MEVLSMGKYGAYVWSSFAITAIVIVICAVQARRMHKNVVNELRTRIRAMESEQ